MSPLLQPADCCVLLVDPRMGHVGRLGPEQQQAHAQALNLAVDIAAAGRAPIHVAYADAPPEFHDWLEGPRIVPAGSVHALGAVGLRWSNSGLNDVLAARKRRSLVLGGFWLETTVTFLAIPALAHGFEVFILMDATPAQKSFASDDAPVETDRSPIDGQLVAMQLVLVDAQKVLLDLQHLLERVVLLEVSQERCGPLRHGLQLRQAGRRPFV